MPLVLGVGLDRFDHQVECTGAVDLACHAVGPIGPEAEAFGEVEQPIHALGVAVQQSEHGARTIRPAPSVAGFGRIQRSAHYHGERNHQGKGNRLLFPEPGDEPKQRGRTVECRHRLGGLLKVLWPRRMSYLTTREFGSRL